jgi:hypothetical protein
MWLGCPVRLSAAVALKFPLLNELPCLGSNCTIVSVREFPLLGMVNGPPLRADINATADANPLASLPSSRLRLADVVRFDNAIAASHR